MRNHNIVPPAIAMLYASALLTMCLAVELKFTNLECKSLDESVAYFRVCKLKIIRRGVISLNVEAEVRKPAYDIWIREALYKKANGFRPFLYNISADFCQFREKSYNNILAKIVFKFIEEFSNLNHSCPYDHDIIVKNLIMSEDKFRLIPLPSGEYMLKIYVDVDKSPKANVNVFFTRRE